MSTLHILSSPDSPVNANNRTDPFSTAIVKFINNMSILGWNCIHYGLVGSEVNCENVNCLPVIHSERNKNVVEYNWRAGLEISKRKKSGDMILCYHGIENKDAAEKNNDLKIIEPSIGYDVSAVFSKFRVFTSYAQMHMFYGERKMLMSPSWFDDVIYNTMSPEEFDYNEQKSDYFLFFGRVIETKGVHIAIQATEKAGQKLIIAGPGSLESIGYNHIPNHVTIAGTCSVEQRRKLMSGAKGIIGPTYYVEPFGNMVTEGYMSGTPAITTDWGGFTETVVQGVTGFRCREMKEFVEAIRNIDSINPKNCKDWAMANCEERVVHKKYDQYLKRIKDSNFYRT